MPANATRPELKLPPMPKPYKLRFLWVAAAMRRLAAMSGIKLSIDGAESASVGPDGSLMFKAGAGTGPADFPFKCPASSGDHSKIRVGTVNGNPVDGGDDISIGSNDSVFVKASLTLTNSSGGYIIGMTDVTYEFYTDTSQPDDSTTESYFPIAQYFGGVCFQYVYGILGHTVDDDGTKTNVPVYFWGQI